MTDPHLTHYMDQLSGLVREVAERLASYRAALIDGGVPEAEADGLVRRMEERIMGPLLDPSHIERETQE